MSGRGTLLVLALGGLFAGAALLIPPPVVRVEADAALLDTRWAERELVEGRSLTEAERSRMREQFRDEELLLRYARDRGLDRTSYAERRLVRKMRFLLSGSTPTIPDAELRALYDAHPERFVPAGATEPLAFERVRDQLQATLGGAAMRARLEARTREVVERYEIVIVE
ncbi:MAG: hypothetical protein AAGD14_18810 [Planctomycetota bacterium]